MYNLIINFKRKQLPPSHIKSISNEILSPIMTVITNIKRVIPIKNTFAWEQMISHYYYVIPLLFTCISHSCQAPVSLQQEETRTEQNNCNIKYPLSRNWRHMSDCWLVTNLPWLLYSGVGMEWKSLSSRNHHRIERKGSH